MNNRLVYLFIENNDFTEEIITSLEQASYWVKSFSIESEFKVAIKEQKPSLIIVDILTKNGKTLIPEFIKKLKQQLKLLVIFMSVSNDVRIRLSALNAGADRYLSKPFKMEKLIHIVNGLTELFVPNPYRVLLIDNNKNRLKQNETTLINAGMYVDILSNPMDCLTKLGDFNPDVLVLNSCLSECSGLELAQVIRLDDTYSTMPIMMLFTESELNQQMETINLYTEDFLLKPVVEEQLISAITSRARRAKRTSQLNKNLQLALRETKYSLEAIDQHDIVSIADVSGRIISINDKFCDVSGYSRIELLGHNHRMIKSGRHNNSFYKEMWRLISSGEIWHVKICNLKKIGDEYWVESTIVPFLNDNGRPYKYVSVRTDITEHIQNQERLNRSQEFANIGTWDWNILKNEVFWSDRVKKLYGYSPDLKNITFENFISIVHPEDREAVNKAVNACLNQGKKYDIEHRVIWPDGSIHWLLERGNVIRNADGEQIQMLGVVQDITDRVLAETSQREIEERFAFAVEGAGDGVWDWDLKSNVMQFSRLYMEMLGYDEAELPNRVSTWSDSVHPDDLQYVQENLQEYLQGRNSTYNVELRLRCKDETYKWVLCRGTVVDRDKGNMPSRMIGIHSDITTRKQIEQNLIGAREDAENANRAKSKFLSSMSHELRTPMNAIMGFGQLLKMEEDSMLTDSQLENVDEIVKASGHLLGLINEVLDLAKIEAGRIELSIETISLGEVLAESLQLISPLAQRRDIEIDLIADGVEIEFDDLLNIPFAIRADHARLRQVLLNLLSNAVKYNREHGKLTVSWSNTDEGNIRVNVSDTGHGIDLEKQQQLFKAFSRLGAEQTDIEGSGIGLVITKNLVELMGGLIGVSSQPEKGSTFWFELKADKEFSVHNKHPKREDIEPKALEVMEMKQQHSVLYIEDNPANLRLVTQLLGRLEGIHMWSAHEPILGLELASEYQPDLILLDINLPGMDGYEVLRNLRKREKTSNIPVIAISANAMPRDIKKGMQAGFDDYITKPIDIEGFMRIVQEKLLGVE